MPVLRRYRTRRVPDYRAREAAQRAKQRDSWERMKTAVAAKYTSRNLENMSQ